MVADDFAEDVENSEIDDDDDSIEDDSTMILKRDENEDDSNNENESPLLSDRVKEEVSRFCSERQKYSDVYTYVEKY